jgi:GntR family transcriptional regulator/MocR family aminotransferase
MLVRLDRGLPLAEQLYAAIRSAILAGELRTGGRIPPSRDLARTNGVSRATVVQAYDRLKAEGYVDGHGARGTRVCGILPAGGPSPSPPRASSTPPRARLGAEGRRMVRHSEIYSPELRRRRPPARWSFDYNATVADRTARLEWGRILRQVIARYESDPPPYDLLARVGDLHHALARYLKATRGVECAPDQIVLVPTPQTALGMAVRLLVDPGDRVALEDPHYLGARETLLARGARVLPVPVDRQGLRTDRLPARSDVPLAYTNPSHQWPTGATLPLARRFELLDWARRRRAYVLENDHNSEYLYGGVPVQSIQGLDDSDRVIYLATFHRLFRPAPGVTFAVVPRSLVPAFAAAVNLQGARVSTLERDALTRFLEEGCLERLVRRASRRMRHRRRALLDALAALGRDDLDVRPSSGGIHLHAVLRGWTNPELDDLVHRCEEAGVRLWTDRPFFLRPPRDPGLLLGFAELSPEEIRAGVARLGEVLAALSP